MIKGIDISMHNGHVNFELAKRDGVRAIIIKATEGVNYIDPFCNEHTKGVKAAGIDFGFYHFMSEKTDPARQARDFYNKIKSTGYTIRPCLDIETNNLGRSRKQVSDRCIEFLEEFKKISNSDCMIYTGGYFGKDYLDDRVKKYPGWIAHYGVEKPMENGFRVIGHQYTENGMISGVGKCDVNNFTEEIFLNSNLPPVKPEPPKPSSPFNDWVRKLQTECNRQGFSRQSVDGIPGKNTLRGCPLVKRGAKGNITRLIQERVGVTADGIFGRNTEKAVMTFQANNGLSVDGQVGKNTWRKLLRL